MFGAPVGLMSNPTAKILTFALILYFVSIIRSIWVAIRLFDIYVDEIKPKIQKTVSNIPKEGKLSDTSGCCLCLFVIFIIFGIIAIL